MLPALEEQNPNHWITKEFPKTIFRFFFFFVSNYSCQSLTESFISIVNIDYLSGTRLHAKDSGEQHSCVLRDHGGCPPTANCVPEDRPGETP